MLIFNRGDILSHYDYFNEAMLSGTARDISNWKHGLFLGRSLKPGFSSSLKTPIICF